MRSWELKGNGECIQVYVEQKGLDSHEGRKAQNPHKEILSPLLGKK